MGKLLDKEAVNKKLLNKNIKLVDEYINNSTKRNFQCLKCFYIWKSTPANLFRKNRGCPCCNKMIRYTNERVDELIAHKKVKRLGEVKGVKKHLLVECLVCNHQWNTIVENIIGPRGCPKCAGNIQLTNEEIDKRLIEKDIKIKRVSDYEPSGTPIMWQCLIETCNYQWKTKQSHILGRLSGCPKCSRRAPYSIEGINNICNKREIKLLSELDTSVLLKNQFGTFSCNKCNFSWNAKIERIMHSNLCPSCDKSSRLTNEIVDHRLIGSNIKRIGDVIINKKTEFKCSICNHSWNTNPTTVCCNKKCPKCFFRKSEKLIFDFLKSKNINFIYHYTIPDLKTSVQKKFTVDFYLPDSNLFIEFNGYQHYMPIRFGNIPIEKANSNFEKQKIRDATIQKYCLSTGIELLEIDGRLYTKEKLTTHLETLFNSHI